MNDYRSFTDLVDARLLIARWATDQQGLGPVPVSDPATARRRWHDAVAEQARRSGQDEAVANRVVVSMLNQMIRLARSVAWWESRAELAMVETVKYASGNLAVASAPAQRAWDAYWSAHQELGSAFGVFGPDSGAPSEAEVQALTDRMDQADAEWRAAWEIWAED